MVDTFAAGDPLAAQLVALSPAARGRLEQALARRVTEADRIRPRSRGVDSAPLSFAQEGMWLLEQELGASWPLVVDRVWRLRGELDVGALRTSLATVVARHEILRTRLVVDRGLPRQLVVPEIDVRLEVIDLRRESEPEQAALARMDAEGRHALRLATEPPLRVTVLRTGDRDQVLDVALHHAAADGVSWGILARELEELYAAVRAGRAAELPTLAVQYADYALWQHGRFAAQRREIDYWCTKLDGAGRMLELPTDRPRSGERAAAGGFVRAPLPSGHVRRLEELARNQGTTIFTAALTAFALLLSRHTGQPDLVIGTPVVLDRARPELEDLIGLFVNMLPLRLDVHGVSFRDLLSRVRAAVLEAYTHHELSFAELVRELQLRRAPGSPPLFQVSFDVRDSRTDLRLDGHDVEPLELGEPQALYDLMVGLELDGESAATAWAYDAALFDRATVVELARQLEAVLAEVCERPDAPLSELRLARDLAHPAITAPPACSGCVHELVEARARAAPGAVAVVDGERKVTYRELDRAADTLAARLQTLGVGRETLVGVCVERSVDLVVALLGVLKAGAAYVPLDPDDPEERRRHVLNETGTPLVVCSPRLRERLSGATPRLLLLDAQGEREEPARVAVHPDDLAYVMYTSGSTGRPKGVCVTHRGIVGLVVPPGFVELAPGDAVAQVASAGFDASTFEIWAPLVNGASVHIVPRDVVLDPCALVDLLHRRGVSVLHVASALVNSATYRRELARLPVRMLLVGGDVVQPHALASLFEQGFRGQVLHCYGPTETTMLAGFEPLTAVRDSRRRLPLGKAIAGSNLYVLDERLDPVPTCAAGELCVGGTRLARGYLAAAGLTAERFSPDPHRPGYRLYRTGDVARRLPDGRIELLGRLDRQVKVRGMRVEPAEVEAALAKLPGIGESAVVLRRDAAGEMSLIAYVAPAPGCALAGSDVRGQLRERLASHLVPAWVIVLDRLPLRPSGQLDEDALPAPVIARGNPAARPQGRAQRLVAGIWRDVLGLERIGADESFFELGGHSLLAVEALARLSAATGLDVPLGVMFAAPTVAGIAAWLTAVASGQQRPTATEAHVVPLHPGSQPPTLVLVHAIGGGLLSYHSLSSMLAGAHPIVGVAGNAQSGESLASLADRYARSLARSVAVPAVLTGWSSGGVLAHEIARGWADRGAALPPVVAIDSRFPARGGPREVVEEDALRSFIYALAMTLDIEQPSLPEETLTQGPEPALKAALASLHGRARLGALGVPELLAHYHVFARNMLAHARHEPQPYAGSVHLILPAGTEPEVAADWRTVAGTLTTCEVDAHHYELLQGPALRFVAGVIRGVLAADGATARGRARTRDSVLAGFPMLRA